MEEGKVSKFSSGLNIIMRLDVLWRNCQDFKRQGQYSKWNDELDTIWLELARDSSPEDYKDVKDDDGKIMKGTKSLFEEFDKKLKAQLPFNDALTGFKKPEPGIFTRRNEQYKTLMEKQLFLARLENKIGKGTSWGEQEDDWD